MDRVIDLAAIYLVFQMAITVVALILVVAFFIWFLKGWNK